VTPSLVQYTIYFNPADYPNKYVTRRFEIFPGYTVPKEIRAAVSSLEMARDAVPPGLVRIPATLTTSRKSWRCGYEAGPHRVVVGAEQPPSGELALSVGIENNRVVIQFGVPTSWIGLDVPHGRAFVAALTAKLDELDANRSG
jgi:hypothetical protein